MSFHYRNHPAILSSSRRSRACSVKRARFLDSSLSEMKVRVTCVFVFVIYNFLFSLMILITFTFAFTVHRFERKVRESLNKIADDEQKLKSLLQDERVEIVDKLSKMFIRIILINKTTYIYLYIMFYLLKFDIINQQSMSGRYRNYWTNLLKPSKETKLN